MEKVKKWFGLCLPRMAIDNEKERQRYLFSSETNIENLGYSFNPHSNLYEIQALKDLVFMETGIKNWVNEKYITLKPFETQGVYYKYELPAIIKDSLYYNNRELVSYNYLTLNNLYYSDRDNYQFKLTQTLVDSMLSLSLPYPSDKSENMNILSNETI
jgi:hypothetical protein